MLVMGMLLADGMNADMMTSLATKVDPAPMTKPEKPG